MDPRETEYVLAPGEFAYVTDSTTGQISTSVGPCKLNLQGTDQPMVFKDGRFQRCNSIREAIQCSPQADERSYVILHNPSASENDAHPKTNAKNSQIPLQYGKRIILNGPRNFPLWPGQIAEVIPGHQLRSNEYLIVKVYNVEEANKSSLKAESIALKTEDGAAAKEKTKENKLVTGQLLIIKGTECSFFIPPTGIEVVQDNSRKYVRDAITLERLEYCILLDESGDKRYVRGPEVVFPSPTEVFVEINGARKFRALELNDQMGIHVKVIADYKEGTITYKAGQELNITGKDTKIYYPRPEHAVIKYGDIVIQHAIAIPKGEGRYVLEKKDGDVKLIRGPIMFLPNPVEQVVVRRILTTDQVQLWFPGNSEALAHNAKLMEMSNDSSYLTDDEFRGRATKRMTAQNAMYSSSLMAADMLAADEMTRKTSYTPPRTITLDTKYDGAVCINIWPGYAVQLVSKSGSRTVVQGPKCILLEYDQTLEVLKLSRGRPKSTSELVRTPYLRVNNNRVSDVVDAETKDLVSVSVTVLYRVNFEGEPLKWFSTENYVQFLADHLRSLIRNAVKKLGIEEFNNQATDVIRNTVLGTSKKEGEPRPGRSFEENGMKVYDIEVMKVVIGNSAIASLLINNQHLTVSKSLEAAQKEKQLEVTKRIVAAEKQIIDEDASVSNKKLEIEKTRQEKSANLTKAELDRKEKYQVTLDKISKAELARKAAESEQEIDAMRDRKQIEVNAFVDQFKAVQPDLVAAIQNASRMGTLDTLAKHLPQATGGLGFLLGKGGMAALQQMVKGNPVLEDALNQLSSTDKK